MRRALAAVVVFVFLLADAPSPAVAVEPPEPGEIRPAIVWDKIPFGTTRKRQTASYSRRHYGVRTYELVDPQVVVIHYTDGTSYDSAWNHFASDASHLGEEPGVCTHFLIDTDGTISQLVNLGIRCRHSIGMNWTAIGIEHVGTSADDVLQNRAVMRSSLRLTAWLMLRYGIDIGNVIGHAETLQSPYHQELYEDWRCMTHADWNHREMHKYRTRLGRVADRLGVPVGGGPNWIDSGC